jgi:adenylyltransferase/sulfurtransferase
MTRIRVFVPTPLRLYTEGLDAIEVDARTVSEALGKLTSRYQTLQRHLYAENGSLRSFVNVYLNDEDIRYLESGVETGVKAGDEIRIVPSIAGGVSRAPER